MIVEINQKLKDPLVTPVARTSIPTSSGHTPSLAIDPYVADPPEKGTVEDSPSITSIIVNLDSVPREEPIFCLHKETVRRLAKIEEWLCVLQGYEM